MIFHENCLLADNSHGISYLIFFRKLGKMSQNLSSAAVVIGASRVKCHIHSKNLKYLFIIMYNYTLWMHTLFCTMTSYMIAYDTYMLANNVISMMTLRNVSVYHN